LYGAETWTLQKGDEKHLESFEMCMEKIDWADRVRNEVLKGVKFERNVLKTIRQGRLTVWVTSCVGTDL
jgi:hypothetical protein